MCAAFYDAGRHPVSQAPQILHPSADARRQVSKVQSRSGMQTMQAIEWQVQPIVLLKSGQESSRAAGSQTVRPAESVIRTYPTPSGVRNSRKLPPFT